jgi:hypothetical protein
MSGRTGIAEDIYEVTQTSTPHTVWHMLFTGQYAYRGQRISNLYPGVRGKSGFYFRKTHGYSK